MLHFVHREANLACVESNSFSCSLPVPPPADCFQGSSRDPLPPLVLREAGCPPFPPRPDRKAASRRAGGPCDQRLRQLHWPGSMRKSLLLHSQAFVVPQNKKKKEKKKTGGTVNRS